VAAREGETRIGQRAAALVPGAPPPKGARVALVGVPEDIGVRANLGRPGTRRMWSAFLPRFLNMQSNAFLDGAAVVVAGTVDVRDLRRATRGIDPSGLGPRSRTDALDALRRATAELDGRVASTVESLRRAGLVPVVVGGGHNNSYGILAGCAAAAGCAMRCVNVDLHADLRPREGRHSGNGFTYALADGHLGRYAVVGMSEAYATEAIVDAVREDERIAAWTFESMLRAGTPPRQAALAAAAHVGRGPATIELDLDAVAGAPASAAAASGFTGAEFRSMATALASALDVHAVHLAEGAPALGPWPAEMLGKLCAEVVRDVTAAIVSR
jgi:formiminoglutamase